jgi:cytidine deaminase
MREPRLNELFRKAMAEAERAYAPYSLFRVGAALLCEDGEVFLGVNVENRSYGLTICAERSAIAAAVSAGKRDFAALAVATPDASSPVPPCGACRQVISEFASSEMPVAFGASDASMAVHTVGELYPLDSLHELAKDS